MSPEEKDTALGRRAWAASMREDPAPIVATREEVEELLEAFSKRQVVDAEPWQPPPFRLEMYGLPVVRLDGRPYVIRFLGGGRAEVMEDLS